MGVGLAGGAGGALGLAAAAAAAGGGAARAAAYFAQEAQVARALGACVPRPPGGARVLGAGAGAARWAFYVPEEVILVRVVDPGADAKKVELGGVQAGVPCELAPGGADGLSGPFAFQQDASVDAFYSRGAIGAAEDPAQLLSEVMRVLKPGGVLLFCEEVRGRGPAMELLQGLLPGGPDLSRDIPALLEAAGFEESDGEFFSEWTYPHALGVATKGGGRGGARKPPAQATGGVPPGGQPFGGGSPR